MAEAARSSPRQEALRRSALRSAAAAVLVTAAVLVPRVALGQVSFVAAGTGCGVTNGNGCTPTIPAGTVQNDVLIAVVHSRTNTTHTCPTNCAGWTEFSTQNGAFANGRLSVWYLRRGATAPNNPTFDGPASESLAAKIWAFRGVGLSGAPTDVSGTATNQAAAATWTGTNLTTTLANAMVVFVGGSMDNNTWGPAGGTTGGGMQPNTASATFYHQNANGTQNSVFLAYDGTPNSAAGAQGSPTNLQASAASDAGRWFTFALKPSQTTLGDGATPTAATIAPGAPAQAMDAFTLQTNSATDAVSSVTVTLAAGSSARIETIAIHPSVDGTGACTGTALGSLGTAVSPLATDTPTIALSGLNATTSLTTYYVCVKPRAHSAMPAPPGGSYSITGTVTAFAPATYQAGGADATSGTVTIDNQSPTPAPSGLAGTAGNTQVVLTWTGEPTDADFLSNGEVVVLRRTNAAPTGVPAEGTNYNGGETVGDGAVACVANPGARTCTASGLTNGTNYYFVAYARDSSMNYSAASAATGAIVPRPSITIGDATTGEAASTLAPGSGKVVLDAFTLQASAGSVTPSSITLTMPAGSAALVETLTLENTSACNQATPYATITNPVSDAPSFTSFSGFSVGTGLTNLWVCLKPKTHANMAAPPGTSVAITGQITAVAATNYSTAGSDTVSQARTVDNLSPTPAVSGLAGVPGNGQARLTWTGEPTAADFTTGGEVVVLRAADAAPTSRPVEGTDYAGGETVGDATVACVATPATRSCTAAGLTNGTDYYFVAYARDANLNYSLASTAIGPVTPESAAAQLVYSNNTATPQARSYIRSLDAFAAATATQTGAAQTFIVDRASSERDEHIAGYVTTGGVLYVLRWNGTAWSSEWNVTVGGGGVNGRRFDIAYENASGRAVVVYSTNGSGGTAELAYRIWNGSSWTAEATLQSARLTGAANSIKLAARKASGSNAIGLAVADTNSDLTAFTWDGSTWANEPTAALSTSLQQTGAAGDRDVFDLAYENLSGALLVVYAATTPANLYARLSGATWTTNQSLGTGRDMQTMFAVADPDPASNRIVIGWDRRFSANRYAIVWNGALGLVTTIGANANATAPPALSHQMTGAWLTYGASKRAIVTYQSTTAGNLDYAYFDVAAGTWTVSQSVAQGSGERRWVAMDVDPRYRNTLVLTYSDANNDLWAKRLVYDAAGLTWSSLDGGTALTATLANNTTQNFFFWFNRLIPPTTTVGNGTEPASTAQLCPGGSALVDAFTLQTNRGTDTLASATVALSAGAGGRLASVELRNDGDTAGFGSVAPAGNDLPVIPLSGLTATTTLTQYKLKITANGFAAIPPGTYPETATISDLEHSPTHVGDYFDLTSATVTIDRQAPADAAWTGSSPDDQKVALSWTNPAADFSQVVVLRSTAAITDAPTDGQSYAAAQTIGASTVVYAGSLEAAPDTGLTNGTGYYYKIFAKDLCGNYSAGVQTGPVVPAPVDARAIYSAGAASTTPVVRGYAGLTNQFVSPGPTVAGATNSTFYVTRASPTRTEHIAGYVTTGGQLYVLRWNGTAWSAEWNVTVGGDGVNGRRFDIAYENLSGDAIVVYSNNTAGTNELRYRIWNGASWTGATNLDPARLVTTPTWIKLLPRPGSDEIAMMAADDGSGTDSARLTALVWNGAGWGNEPSAALATNFPSTWSSQVQDDAFDMAWETQSGVLWTFWTQGTPQQYRRSLTAARPGTWNAATSFGTGDALPGQMAAASDPRGNNVLVAWSSGNSIYASVNAGGTWSSATTALATNGQGTNANEKIVAARWLVANATSYPVVLWGTGTAGTLGYRRATVAGATVTWQTAATQAFGTTGGWGWIDTQVDPWGADTMMLTYSTANNDLFARRLVVSGAGPTFTWTDPNSGALTATLTNNTTQNFAFAYDRWVTPSIALGDNLGTEASNQTICYNATATTDIDFFTLAGRNTNVTSVGVTLTGPAGVIGTIAVTDDAGNQLGSKSNPALTDAIALGTPPALSRLPSQYRLEITPNAAMTATGTLTVTGTVTSLANSNGATPTGSDPTSATITIDNQAPAASSGLTAVPGESQVALAWTAPGTDYTGSIVVRSTSPITWTPTKGAVYTDNQVVGAVTIAKGNASPALSSYTVTGLTNGVTYYFRVFSFDGCGIYGAASNEVSARPNATTTVSNGTPAAPTASVCPGGTATFANAFAVRVSSGANDTITSLTATLPAGTAQAVARVDLVPWNGTSEGASIGNATVPSGDSFTVSGLSLAATTTLAQYRVKLTPKARGAFPPGAWAVTAPLSGGTHSLADNNLVFTDVADGTVTIDQQGPSEVIGLTATTPAARQVRLDWANPSSDFSGTIRIYRHTADFTDAPVNGSDPAAGTLPSGVVVIAPTAGATTYTDSAGLADATTYFYKVFVRDGCMNWSSGADLSVQTSDSRTQVLALVAEQMDCTHAYLTASYAGDYNANNTVTFTRGTQAGGPFGTTICANVGGGTNPRTCTDSTLAAGVTYYYRATFADSDGFGTGSTADSAAVDVPAGCANVTPGSTTTNTTAPVVSIVNPSNGAVVGGTFRVQVRVFDRPGTGVSAVNLSTNGAAADCTATSLNGFTQTSHSFPAPVPPLTGVTRVYERQLTLAADRSYLLRACARNAGGTVQSELVRVTYRVTHTGDGKLLVRDDSSQLCTDCHNLPTHSSESTSNKYGSWSTACADCHQPHGTKNLGLVKEQVAPPAYRGFVAPQRVVLRDMETGDSGTSANVSFVTSDATKLAAGTYGPCQACHTQTVDPNAGAPQPARWRRTGNADPAHYQASTGTMTCTVCHAHSLGFAAGEPPVPGSKCGGCHKTIFDWMRTTGGRANAHRIDLDQSGDTALDWSAQATLSSVPSSQRTCLNTCHADHPHDLTSPTTATHEGNVYADPLTNASRATASSDRVGKNGVGTVNRAKTDFDPAANDGLCVKCHQRPIVAGGTQVAAATFGASAHDYTQNTVGATTYTWTYPLHDGGRFDRNCTKCHASRTEGTTPTFGSNSTRGIETVHGSADAALLAGTKNPAGTAAGFVCYNCHGSAANPAAGAQGNRSARNIEAQAAKTYRHNVNADAVHSSDTEFSGTYPVGTMHVSCMDCHDVHGATAANPLANAPGVTPTNSATPGAVPTSYTFTRIPAASPELQYKVCFRCHSNFTGTLPTGTTNAAIPFNPANESLHYVEADTGAVPVNTTGSGKGIWQNALFNLTTVPTQTRRYVDVMMPRPGVTHTDASLRSLPLRCSDCHGDNAADGGNAVPEGPHGSTVARMLKVPAGSQYTVWTATSAVGNTNVWCYNCHISTFAGSGFAGQDGSLHTSKHGGERCQDCHLANPHGQTAAGAAAQRKHLLKPATFTDAADSAVSGSWNEGQHSTVIPGCT